MQLTLGLETWDLSYFNHILIYPQQYKNPNTAYYHKGETNLGGFICFSWEDVLAGNQNPKDKINLGLHEFAHALRFNGIKGNNCDYFFEHYFPRWFACALLEFKRMRNHLPSIFRKYGAVNINEFFSVVVETFFETPSEFKIHLPELYRQTAILLNQSLTDTDTVIINCREDLLKTSSFPLSPVNYPFFSYKLPFSGSTIMFSGFSIIGLFSLSDGGYLYPSSYICFFVSMIFWLFLEKKYARVSFEGSRVKIIKGFLFFQRYKIIDLPLTCLISVTANYENKIAYFNETGLLTLNSLTIKYYYKTDFFEEEIHCNIDDVQFNKLCYELRKNLVHVFVKKPRN